MRKPYSSAVLIATSKGWISVADATDTVTRESVKAIVAAGITETEVKLMEVAEIYMERLCALGKTPEESLQNLDRKMTSGAY